MRVFVTGASGWIGSAAVRELLSAGHEVTGLARSDAAAERVSAIGASVVRGDLDDLAVLRRSAEPADAVLHLGFNHDFSDPAGAGRTERAALETFGDVLAGSGRALLLASGMARLTPGAVATEETASPFVGPDAMRGGGENLALSFADKGVRPVALRFAPTVHGEGDHGFVSHIAGIARDRGVAGYVDDGSNRWAAVHRSDAARLIRLAVESPGVATIVHASAETGVPAREIAEHLGAAMGLPVRSVPAAEAEAHFGWMGRFFGTDLAGSSDLTRQRLGWEPTGPTLFDDIDDGFYNR